MAVVIALAILTIAFIGFTTGQDCSYRARCGQKIDAIPECTSGDSAAVTCLLDHLNRCHRDKEAEKHLEKAKLQQKVICDNNEAFKDGFKNQDQDCWTSMDKCLIPISVAKLDFDATNQAKREEVCDQLRPGVETCKKAPGIKDDCKIIRSAFIDTAFRELKCSGSGIIAAQISLITIATFVAIWRYTH